MYGRRSFLRRGLGLLSGGAAGAVSGRLAAASEPPELYGAAGSPSPPAESDSSRPRASILQLICEAAQLDPVECEWWTPPKPLPPPQPQSVLQTHPLLTVYGRSFGVAPVLGLLGALNSFDELERSVEPWTSAMSELAEAPVMVAPHLIYGLAIPCQDADDSCVIFLDASGVDLIEDYIKPAADRGMAVFLDTQIGRLHPTYFVQRMIDAGYLAYPNVHVALDPEFATQPDQDMPGVIRSGPSRPPASTRSRRPGRLCPRGGLVAQESADRAPVRRRPLGFLVYGSGQAEHRDLSGSRLVFDADGFGSPNAKVHKYNAITDPTAYPQLEWRGIKIFQHNRHAPRFSDTPVMTPRQIFGLDPTPAGWRIWAPPHLVVLA